MKKFIMICLLLVCALAVSACGAKEPEKKVVLEPATAVFTTNMGTFEINQDRQYRHHWDNQLES